MWQASESGDIGHPNLCDAQVLKMLSLDALMPTPTSTLISHSLSTAMHYGPQLNLAWPIADPACLCYLTLFILSSFQRRHFVDVKQRLLENCSEWLPLITEDY